MTEIITLKKIDASSAPKLDAALKAAIEGALQLRARCARSHCE